MADALNCHNSAEGGSSGATKINNKQIKKSRSVYYAHRHPRGRAKTSARAIRLAQRRADVINYRLQRYSFKQIGDELKISPSRAHELCVEYLRDMVPVETRETVLRLELEKLDMLEAAFAADAAKADIPAAEMVLRISNQRAKLLGLYPDTSKGGHGAVHVNVSNSAAPDAEDVGIQISFIQSPHRLAEAAGQVIEGGVNGNLPVPAFGPKRGQNG
jgi:hypothetical protein